jgi:small subunit ribosomal protein S9
METHASTATETAEQPATHEGAHAATSIPELTLGSGAPAAEPAEPRAAPKVRGRIDRFGAAMGTGRRKTSVARVRMQRGSGKFTINDRALEDYFRVERNRALVEGPLAATDTLGKFDIWVRAQGGGTTGQVGAIVLGIARALQAMDPGLHPRLSEGGFLTRDGRMVERKKYGRKKARRSFQFSKR